MLWQKRNLSKSSINNKLTQHSLQANHDMSPPTKSDTDSARVSSCICLTRPALLYGKGSLTVEAAFVVSLFFILVIILISFIDLVRVYAGITVSLNESAKKLGMYAYVSEAAPESSPVGAVGTGVCIGYAQARLPKEERGSVSCAGSSYRNDMVDLRAQVTYRFPVSFAGIRQVIFPVRAVVHGWTGYQGDKAEGISGSFEDMVYVTERQTVYHTHRDCSHMNVTVYSVSQKEAKKRRNDYGEKYGVCSHCKDQGNSGTVYITPKGDSYHFSAECSALKRSGRLVKKSQVSSLSECSRCRERG